MTARLILVRHGQTAHNKERRLQGHTDTPLDETGQAQARRLAEHFAHLGGWQSFRIHSSDLTRARSTAEALAAALGGEVQPFAALREIHVGDWEGRLLSEIEQQEPELHAHFWGGHPQARPSGAGETPDEVGARMLAHVQGHWPAEGETLVVVSHGVALSSLLSRLLGTPYQTDWQSRVYEHRNAGYSVLELNPHPRQVLRAEVALSPHLI